MHESTFLDKFESFFVFPFVLHIIFAVVFTFFSTNFTDRPEVTGSWTTGFYVFGFIEIGTFFSVLLFGQIAPYCFGSSLNWAYVVAIGIPTISMIVFLVYGYYAFAALSAILAIGQTVQIVSYYDILEHTTCILSLSRSILTKYSPLVTVVYSFWCFHFAWSVFYVFLLSYTLYHTSSQWFVIYILFSYVWTSEVIASVLHATASNLVSAWYYRLIDSPTKIVKKFLSKTLTTSLGSIAMASLFLSAFRIVRSLASLFVGTNLICTLSPAQELLSFPDTYLSSANRLTIVIVAFKDYPYLKAVKYMWEVMKNNAAFIMTNNLTTFNALRIGYLVWSMLLGIIVAYWVDWDDIGLFPSTIRLFSLLVGYLSSSLFIGTYQSSVDSMMVCLASNGSNGHKRLDELAVIMESLQYQKNVPIVFDYEASDDTETLL